MDEEREVSALVEQLLQARDRPADPGRETLLALGPWVEAAPMFLFLDPILDPYETRTYGVLWALLKDQGQQAVMPTYEEIMRLGNIRSRDRVARSITVLRITRWIVLLERARDSLQRNVGNIYVLNQEPMDFAAVLELDGEYMRFLRETAANHRSRRIRHLAQAALESLLRREDPTAPMPESERIHSRLQAFHQIRSDREAPAGPEPGSMEWFLGTVTTTPVREANPARSRVRETNSGQSPVRDANSAPETRVRDSNSVCSSSSYIKNTTTPPISPPSSEKHLPEHFDWPEFLSENVRELLCIQVRALPEEDRQPMLDELVGQMRFRESQGDPIRSPVGYFRRMCERYLAGEGGPGAHAEAEQRRRANEARLARLAENPGPAGPAPPARPPAPRPASGQVKAYVKELKRLVGRRVE